MTRMDSAVGCRTLAFFKGAGLDSTSTQTNPPTSAKRSVVNPPETCRGAI
jgi:hypothetical protein